MLNLDASNNGQNQAGARCNPCQARFSPRKGSEHLRVIMNFSYANNETAINAWISNNMYIDKATDISYPYLENLMYIIKKKGRGCLLFKWDLLKCYRQIFMDPGPI